jgi:hypothetical protein
MRSIPALRHSNIPQKVYFGSKLIWALRILWGRRRGGQITYTHVSKCKNNKIKQKKESFVSKSMFWVWLNDKEGQVTVTDLHLKELQHSILTISTWG